MRAPARFLLALTLLASLAVVSGLALANGDPLRCPSDFKPPILVTLSPPAPCAGDSVRVVFRACGDCPKFLGIDSSGAGILIRSEIDDPAHCLVDHCQPESLSYSLGALAAGRFVFRFVYLTRLTLHDQDLAAIDHHGGDTLVCNVTHADSIAFSVSGNCGTPPPPGKVPFVTDVHIGRGAPCDTCPQIACPGDSIPLHVQGAFDSSCMSFYGAALALPLAAHYDIPIPGPIPAPPMIRLFYKQLACPESTCTNGTFPWSADFMLPPLPSRSAPYHLSISAAQLLADCTGPTDSVTALGGSSFPFVVAASCSSVVSPACLIAHFDVAGRASDERCDAFVTPGHPGNARFEAGSGVSLYGLQGEFKLDPPKLAVSNLTALGEAAAMHLQWQATDHGAKFVLYSDGKAHISPIDPAHLDSTLAAILDVQVSAGTDSSGPGKSGDKGNVPKVKLRFQNLLGADSLANGLDLCPTFAADLRSFVQFCPGPGCDYNGDGSIDVRDLVAMIRCLHDSTACPAGAVPPDCDGDSTFGVPDVMCCAIEILHGDHPGNEGGHHDASLAMNFGAPIQSGSLVDIPVTLDGDNPIGGARLAFDFPADRYELRDVVFPSNPNCLGLYQGSSGRVDVGLLELGDLMGSSSARAAREARALAAGAAHHTFTLRLALRPGQTAGGEVSLALADISDPSGALVTASLGTPVASLGSGSGGVMMAPARPNPFGRSMTFAVTMAKPGNLEVTIHDVSGRVVATLNRGSVAAGAHSFTWNGTSSDGSRAANGIYFYRARANGQTLSSKVVFIREE